VLDRTGGAKRSFAAGFSRPPKANPRQ
jgi:hypothetical protein